MPVEFQPREYDHSKLDIAEVSERNKQRYQYVSQDFEDTLVDDSEVFGFLKPIDTAYDEPIFANQSDGGISVHSVSNSSNEEKKQDAIELWDAGVLERDSQAQLSGSSSTYTVEIDMQSSSQREDPFLTRLTVNQRECAVALGIEYVDMDWLKRNYNIVTDRTRVEELRRIGNQERLEQYKEEVRKNMETSLMERMNVAESHVYYTIKDGQLYSHFFPNEPFSKVLLRGYQYRRDHGSSELDREWAELVGWRKITKWTKERNVPGRMDRIITFSPPGKTEDSAYKKRFVDVYDYVEEKDKDPYVKLTRLAVDLDEEGYDRAVNNINGNVLKGLNSRFRSKEALLLSSPLETNKSVDDIPLKGMSLKDFREIFDGQVQRGSDDRGVRRFIEYYISVLYRDDVPWRELAVVFNAILNKADQGKEYLENRRKAEERGIVEVYSSRSHSGSFEAEVINLGNQEVAIVEGHGCPSSKGYSVSNSVAQFDMSSGFEYTGANAKNDPSLCTCRALDGRHAHCDCGHPFSIGVGLTTCPGCGKGKTC